MNWNARTFSVAKDQHTHSDRFWPIEICQTHKRPYQHFCPLCDLLPPRRNPEPE